MDEQKIRELTLCSADNYYVRVMSDIESGKKVTWNWAAFFGTFHWMLYRKMYIPAFLCFSMMLFLMIAGSIFTLLSAVIFVMVGSGAFGNLLYHWYVKRKINSGYQINKKYNPVCLSMVFFQMWLVYPTIIGAIAAAAKHSSWLTQNAALFDSTKELAEAGSILNPAEFKVFVASALLLIVVLLLQCVVFPVGFWLRDRYSLRRVKKKTKTTTALMDEENIRAVTSTKADVYYLAQFKKIESGKIFSVNYASYFFGMFCGMFWFLYRKMYKTAAILFLIFCCYEAVVIHCPGTVSIVAQIICHATSFVFMLGLANHLYYMHIKSICTKQNAKQ